MKKMTTCNVVRLKTPDFSFEPCKFKGNLVIEKYKHHTFAVGMCKEFLKMTPAEMKIAVAKIDAMPGVDSTEDLIKEFESISKDLAAFSEMFDDAATRLTIINAKLV
jgi:hypothetical protein